MSDTTETRWFKILVFVASGFTAGISLANVIYYNRIRNATCAAVSKGEATALMWVNIIGFIITTLIFLWSLWRLMFSRDFRVKAQGTTLGYLGNQGQLIPGTTVMTPEGPKVVGSVSSLSTVPRETSSSLAAMGISQEGGAATGAAARFG